MIRPCVGIRLTLNAEAEPLLVEGYHGMEARGDRIEGPERYRLDHAGGYDLHEAGLPRAVPAAIQCCATCTFLTANTPET